MTEDESFVKVVNASDIEARYCDSSIEGADDIMRKISFIHIDSNMVPYISPEEWATYREGYERTGKKFWERKGDRNRWLRKRLLPLYQRYELKRFSSMAVLQEGCFLRKPLLRSDPPYMYSSTR